jgi:hypothetical protein
MNAMLASEFRPRNAGVVLFEDCDDLRFRETTLTQWKRLLPAPLGSAVDNFRWHETVVSGQKHVDAVSEKVSYHSTFAFVQFAIWVASNPMISI